jgi:AraC-like DNA-binding protein
MLQRHTRSPYFGKIFLVLASSMAGLLVLATIAVHAVAERSILEQVQSLTVGSLRQLDASIAEVADSMEQVAIQAYFDPAVNELIFANHAEDDVYLRALRSLRSYRLMSPNTLSVYLYRKRSDTFYTTISHRRVEAAADFFDVPVATQMQAVDRYRDIQFSLRPGEMPGGSGPLVCTFIFYDRSARRYTQHDAIIINNSIAPISNQIRALSTGPGTRLLIVQPNGQALVAEGESLTVDQASRYPAVELARGHNEAYGSIVTGSGGQKALVSHISSQLRGWEVMKITPYRHLMADVQKVRRTTVGIVAGLLTLCLVYALITSLRVARPIDRLAATTQRLGDERKRNLYDLQQRFLRLFIQSNILQSRELLKERFASLGLDADFDADYCMVLFQIDGFREINDQLSFEQLTSMHYGIAKVIMDHVARLTDSKAAALTIDNGRGDVILVYDPREINVSAEGYNFVRCIQDEVSQSLSVSLSASCCSDSRTIERLKEIYELTTEVARERFVKGPGSINPGRATGAPDDFSYPVLEQEALIDALRRNRKDQAVLHYDAIIQQARTYGHSTLWSAIMHVAVSVDLFLKSLESDDSHLLSTRMPHFMNQIQQRETLSEVNRDFYDLFEEIVRELQRRTETKRDVITDAVIPLIRDRYSDPNLSVVALADAVGLSSVYLGKKFKKRTSSSVATYINRIRVEAAEELLKRTHATVTEIADQVGYSSVNYFCRVFRKTHLLSPQEYRREHQLLELRKDA